MEAYCFIVNGYDWWSENKPWQDFIEQLERIHKQILDYIPMYPTDISSLHTVLQAFHAKVIHTATLLGLLFGFSP